MIRHIANAKRPKVYKAQLPKLNTYIHFILKTLLSCVNFFNFAVLFYFGCCIYSHFPQVMNHSDA